MPVKGRVEAKSNGGPVERAPSRVVIEGVEPEIDCGRFPIKRTVGEEVVGAADIFVDGHDSIRAVVQHRRVGDESWEEAPMTPVENDRWKGRFTVGSIGRHEYTVSAWIDVFGSWRRDLGKKAEAGQNVAS